MIKKEEITLPTIEQLQELEVLKNNRTTTTAYTTDLYTIEEGYEAFGGNGNYWTKTPGTSNEKIITIDHHFGDYYMYPKANEKSRGVRPIIPLSENDLKDTTFNKYLGVEEIEYGEYPQTLASKDIGKELENLYQKNKLVKTNKVYTNMKYKEKVQYEEYEYKGNKYIRIKTPKEIKWPRINLTKYIKEDNKTFWVKVQPIKWLVDKKEKIAISSDILAVMPFSYNNNNDYEKSDVKNFLENYFLKEIQTSKINENIDIEKINNLIDIVNILYPNENKKEKILVKK